METEIREIYTKWMNFPYDENFTLKVEEIVSGVSYRATYADSCGWDDSVVFVRSAEGWVVCYKGEEDDEVQAHLIK